MTCTDASLVPQCDALHVSSWADAPRLAERAAYCSATAQDTRSSTGYYVSGSANGGRSLSEFMFPCLLIDSGSQRRGEHVTPPPRSSPLPVTCRILAVGFSPVNRLSRSSRSTPKRSSSVARVFSDGTRCARWRVVGVGVGVPPVGPVVPAQHDARPPCSPPCRVRIRRALPPPLSHRLRTRHKRSGSAQGRLVTRGLVSVQVYSGFAASTMARMPAWTASGRSGHARGWRRLEMMPDRGIGCQWERDAPAWSLLAGSPPRIGLVDTHGV